MASNLQSDLKLLAKPPNFAGDPEHWSNWKFALVNWLSLVDMDYPSLMEQVGGRTTHVDVDEHNADLVRQTNLLYVLLASLLTGRAQVFARSIPDRNGFELWRLLSQEFEPARTSRALVQLIEVINFRLDVGGEATFLERLMTWERLTHEYEKQHGKKIDEDLRRACLLKQSPAGLKQHLAVHAASLPTYVDMRNQVNAYLQTKQIWKAPSASSHQTWDQSPSPMEVDAIEQSYGKGKSKGKGKEQGKDKGKPKGKEKGGKPSDKGKKGDGKTKGKTSGKDDKKNSSEVKCWKCGLKGHISRDCRNTEKVQNIEEGAAEEPAGEEIGNIEFVCAFTESSTAVCSIPAKVSHLGRGVRRQILLDSGATTHVVPFSEFKQSRHLMIKSEKNMISVTGSSIHNYGEMRLTVRLPNGNLLSTNVVVGDVHRFVFSVSALAEKGVGIRFDHLGAYVTFNNITIFAPKHGKLYLLTVDIVTPECIAPVIEIGEGSSSSSSSSSSDEEMAREVSAPEDEQPASPAPVRPTARRTIPTFPVEAEKPKETVKILPVPKQPTQKEIQEHLARQHVVRPLRAWQRQGEPAQTCR